MSVGADRGEYACPLFLHLDRLQDTAHLQKMKRVQQTDIDIFIGHVQGKSTTAQGKTTRLIAPLIEGIILVFRKRGPRVRPAILPTYLHRRSNQARRTNTSFRVSRFFPVEPGCLHFCLTLLLHTASNLEIPMFSIP